MVADLFNAQINGVRLFECEDRTYSISNGRLSGGLSVEFSRQELAALQFMVDQAVADIDRRHEHEWAALKKEHQSGE